MSENGHGITGSKPATEKSKMKNLLSFHEDENKERGNWSGRFEFVLSALGMAVGLGNVWRFPYLCYSNGGGAFLIPYVIMLTFVGIPLFFLELSLGQFTSTGPLTCWEFAPIFRGTGIAMWIVTFLISIYYNIIIAWGVYYLFASFTSHLPWATCNGWWNSDHCTTRLPVIPCNETNQFKQINGSCINNTGIIGLWNKAVYENTTNRTLVSPSEEYFNNHVLRINNGIDDDWQNLYWDLTLCLLSTWVIVFLCLIKGIKSSGKVVWVTVLFPYVVLIILFFRGIVLEGAGQGIYFYLVPQFERLLDARVWKDAAVQIFFSLATGVGSLITLASYNRFHNNTLRDSLIISLINSATSIFAGFVVFSFLGYMAAKQNTTVDKVVSSGPGLVFVVYPTALTLLPISPFWSILFFLMLLTLGIDGQFATVEMLVTSLIDCWPRALRNKKIIVTAVTCSAMFLLGLPLCTGASLYVIDLMDTYAGGWTLLLIGITECLIISYIYGANRFFSDIEIMNGFRPRLWWKICWMGASPLLIIAILLFSMADYRPPTFGASELHQRLVNGLGWIMSMTSFLAIPVYAVYYLIKERGTCVDRLRNSIKPTKYWGPALMQHRKLVTSYVEDFLEDPWSDQTENGVDEANNKATSVVNGPPTAFRSNRVEPTNENGTFNDSV